MPRGAHGTRRARGNTSSPPPLTLYEMQAAAFKVFMSSESDKTAELSSLLDAHLSLLDGSFTAHPLRSLAGTRDFHAFFSNPDRIPPVEVEEEKTRGVQEQPARRVQDPKECASLTRKEQDLEASGSSRLLDKPQHPPTSPLSARKEPKPPDPPREKLDLSPPQSTMLSQEAKDKAVHEIFVQSQGTRNASVATARQPAVSVIVLPKRTIDVTPSNGCERQPNTNVYTSPELPKCPPSPIQKTLDLPQEPVKSSSPVLPHPSSPSPTANEAADSTAVPSQQQESQRPPASVHSSKRADSTSPAPDYFETARATSTTLNIRTGSELPHMAVDMAPPHRHTDGASTPPLLTTPSQPRQSKTAEEDVFGDVFGSGESQSQSLVGRVFTRPLWLRRLIYDQSCDNHLLPSPVRSDPKTMLTKVLVRIVMTVESKKRSTRQIKNQDQTRKMIMTKVIVRSKVMKFASENGRTLQVKNLILWTPRMCQ